MWTLVVCLALGCAAIEGPQVIVVDGFSKVDDCRFAGKVNIDYLNPEALYRCDKTNRPAVRCKPDTRTYGRTGECLT